MELFRTPAQQSLFDRISGISPHSFEEFNEAASEVMPCVAEIYGIAAAEYSIDASPNMPLADAVLKSAVLLEAAGETEQEPVLFRYSFDPDGEIIFSVHTEKGVKLSGEDMHGLELIFRQLYYILNSFVLRFVFERLVVTDQGTGIANLAAFMRLGNQLASNGKIRGYTALYFNIHNFKSVHKSLTYLEGNSVLEKYCRIVADAVNRKELVARLGGDNFVALIFNENVDYFFDLIQNMVVKYEKDGKTMMFMFGATIGVARLKDEKNAGEIMMRISAAYQSARDGRAALGFYDPKLSLEIIESKIILSKFTQAISEREFFAVYQPKVDVKSRRLLGAEALVRWGRGEGYVMPGDFIPILEKDGCVTALDFYMLEEVCKFIRKLINEGIEPVKISVNFSKRHLSNNKLVEEIIDVLERYETPRRYIEIELTEREDFHNNRAMQEVVSDLNLLGIKTSIDDFGTGYSSLGMLKTLQIDTLKIDRSFIPQSNIDGSEKSLLMLKGVVSLAKSLGLTIVAEGVETPEQLEIIKGMDCDMVQGYIFDKPLSESEFIKRIKKGIYE